MQTEGGGGGTKGRKTARGKRGDRGMVERGVDETRGKTLRRTGRLTLARRRGRRCEKKREKRWGFKKKRGRNYDVNFKQGGTGGERVVDQMAKKDRSGLRGPFKVLRKKGREKLKTLKLPG